MTKCAVIYARVSTVKSAESDLSIPDQLDACRRYCRQHGYTVVTEYFDPGLSGRDDNRPEFQRMIDDARSKTGGFELIVVHSWSRFFRDLFLAEWYRLRLEKLGVQVISITQDFGNDTQGKLTRQIFGAFDEYSSAETSKHVLRTMIKNAREGFANGRPPFGYKSVTVEKRGEKEKKKFVINEEEAEIVQLIFRLSLGGLSGFDPMGVKEISKELDRRNIKKGNYPPDDLIDDFAGHLSRSPRTVAAQLLSGDR